MEAFIDSVLSLENLTNVLEKQINEDDDHDYEGLEGSDLQDERSGFKVIHGFKTI